MLLLHKMRTIYVTRHEHFNAAHKLWNDNWSDEKNDAVFGKCANKNWHGHNYELYVTVKGTPNQDTGYVIDLKILSDIIKENILDKVDHKNLNLDVAFMKGVLASTENLCLAIWDILHPLVKQQNCTLHCVKLYETRNNFAEYYGE